MPILFPPLILSESYRQPRGARRAVHGRPAGTDVQPRAGLLPERPGGGDRHRLPQLLLPDEVHSADQAIRQNQLRLPNPGRVHHHARRALLGLHPQVHQELTLDGRRPQKRHSHLARIRAIHVLLRHEPPRQLALQGYQQAGSPRPQEGPQNEHGQKLAQDRGFETGEDGNQGARPPGQRRHPGRQKDWRSFGLETRRPSPVQLLLQHVLKSRLSGAEHLGRCLQALQILQTLPGVGRQEGLPPLPCLPQPAVRTRKNSQNY